MGTYSDGHLTPVKDEAVIVSQRTTIMNSLFFNRFNPLAVKSTARIEKMDFFVS